MAEERICKAISPDTLEMVEFEMEVSDKIEFQEESLPESRQILSEDRKSISGRSALKNARAVCSLGGEEHYKQAIQLDPNYAYAYYQLGALYRGWLIDGRQEGLLTKKEKMEAEEKQNLMRRFVISNYEKAVRLAVQYNQFKKFSIRTLALHILLVFSFFFGLAHYLFGLYCYFFVISFCIYNAVLFEAVDKKDDLLMRKSGNLIFDIPCIATFVNIFIPMLWIGTGKFSLAFKEIKEIIDNPLAFVIVACLSFSILFSIVCAKLASERVADFLKIKKEIKGYTAALVANLKPEYYRSRAEAYCETGKFKEALEDCDKASELEGPRCDLCCSELKMFETMCKFIRK